jgi:hypothetical protein
MRAKALIALLFAITLGGCHKNSDSVNSFQFQMGGTTFSFDSVSAMVDTTSGVITSILAMNTKTRSYVTVGLQSNSRNIAGIYSRIFPQPHASILGIFSVLIEGGPYANAYSVEGAPFTFSVDQAGNNIISGTFAGYLAILPGVQNDTIKNGQFRVPYKYR